jgi:hypothetical protein
VDRVAMIGRVTAQRFRLRRVVPASDPCGGGLDGIDRAPGVVGGEPSTNHGVEKRISSTVPIEVEATPSVELVTGHPASRGRLVQEDMIAAA